MTSGQLALTIDVAIPEGAEAQATLIFANIDLILAEAGTCKAGTLRVNAYVTDR